MARIKIEGIIEHLEVNIRRALEDTVKEAIPGAKFDARDLFRTFRKKVGIKCSTWERVPEKFVEADDHQE